MYYYNVFVFFIEKCKVFDLFLLVLYLFLLLWSVNINMVYCIYNKMKKLKEVFFVKYFRKEMIVNEEMVLYI